MEAYKVEALRLKENAEKRFSMRDYVAAKDYAMRAQMLYPTLDGICQMVSTFGVYLASEIKVGGEPDCYTILGLDPSAGKVKVKKQYKKLATLLNPEKNQTLGADGALKLVSDAWLLLSDAKKRRKFDRKRKKQGVIQANLPSAYSGGVTSFDKPAPSHGLDTFWTVCTSCQVQYEYLRKYLNKKLSCKNCRGVFVAVETGKGPVNGAFPYSNWSYAPVTGYGGHVSAGVTCPPKSELYFTENGASGYHSGHSSEYLSNVSFQWGSHPGASASVVTPNGYSTKSKVNGKHRVKNGTTDMDSNVLIGYSEPSVSKGVRPHKKRKFERARREGNKELVLKTTSELDVVNGYGNTAVVSKPEAQSEMLTRRYSPAPPFDVRKVLMEKARGEISNKLKEMNISLGEMNFSLAKAPVSTVCEKKAKTQTGGVLKTGTLRKRNMTRPFRRLELKRTESMPITVPDSDFHDFDKDRSEECFKPKQIWAIYDEEDGMPRLYCLIRDVISVNPFKIQISYLNSKTDTEFGDVKWVVYGFTKSCGSFRAFNSDIVEEVNLFSHLLEKEKARRGGCVRIYPRSGDIWAVYRNWSNDWNRKTPDEVRHQYEMVEVIDDYSEDFGLWVTPLVKLDGYKTVYHRSSDKDSNRYIPRKEMLRFSHQVPSWPLKRDGVDFPDGCWDLDPAATPDELLQGSNDLKTEDNPCQTVVVSDGLLQGSNDMKTDDNHCQTAVASDGLLQGLYDMKSDDNPCQKAAIFDEPKQSSVDMITEDKRCQGAATPDELRQGLIDINMNIKDKHFLTAAKSPNDLLEGLIDIDMNIEHKPFQATASTPDELLQGSIDMNMNIEDNPFQAAGTTPDEFFQGSFDMNIEDKPCQSGG